MQCNCHSIECHRLPNSGLWFWEFTQNTLPICWRNECGGDINLATWPNMQKYWINTNHLSSTRTLHNYIYFNQYNPSQHVQKTHKYARQNTFPKISGTKHNIDQDIYNYEPSSCTCLIIDQLLNKQLWTTHRVKTNPQPIPWITHWNSSINWKMLGIIGHLLTQLVHVCIIFRM